MAVAAASPRVPLWGCPLVASEDEERRQRCWFCSVQADWEPLRHHTPHLDLKPPPPLPNPQRLLKATSSMCLSLMAQQREGERGAAPPRLQDHDPVDSCLPVCEFTKAQFSQVFNDSVPCCILCIPFVAAGGWRDTVSDVKCSYQPCLEASSLLLQPLSEEGHPTDRWAGRERRL